MASKTGFSKVFAAVSLIAALPFAPHADAQSSGPAVSGFNTKFSGEGGVYDDAGAGLFQGSLTTPLGHAYGVQIDGVLGSIDDDFLGGGAVHLFTRDPSRYLFGIYGSYHSWDSIDITRLAAEGEVYMGRLTAGGIAGWEDVDVPRTKNGLTVLTRDDDHFFTELDLSYYVKDNTRLSIGYHYENEEHLGVAQFEHMPNWASLPATVFATGYFGENDHARVTGGIRFYFGRDRNKSLIRRHREDDPGQNNPVFPELKFASPIPEPFCGNGIVEAGEQCDGGQNCTQNCELSEID